MGAISELKKCLDKLVKDELLRIIDFNEAKETKPSGIIAFIGNPYDMENMTIVFGNVIPGGVSGAVYTPSSEVLDSGLQTGGSNKAVIYADTPKKDPIIPSANDATGMPMEYVIAYFK